jgi:predicted nuclease with TOPRIM domain
VNENVRYQPPFNEVLDEVDKIKDRIEKMEHLYEELRGELSHIHKVLYALDERIDILANENHQ